MLHVGDPSRTGMRDTLCHALTRVAAPMKVAGVRHLLVVSLRAA
jgi:hypothetical protein